MLKAIKKYLSFILLITLVGVLFACELPPEEPTEEDPLTYTVTFNADNGTAPVVVTVEEGDTVEEPNAPLKEGFVFDAWYLREFAYDFSQVVNANITLTAHYDAEPIVDVYYQISFETGKGFGLPDKEVLAGAPIDELPVIYILNEQITGWYLDEDLEAAFDLVGGVNESLTLYAKWGLRQDVDYDATYRRVIARNVNFSPTEISAAQDITIQQALITPLFRRDYDWPKAIDLGLAAYVGDFRQGVDLPTYYAKELASSYPVNISGDGLTWQLQMSEGFTFEDGTPINAYTFEYSVKQLLDPTYQFSNGALLAEIPIENAQQYYYQNDVEDGTEISWEEVGFKAIDAHTIEVTFSQSRIYSHVMEMFMLRYLTLIHPENFEENPLTYGTAENPFVSYGPYAIDEWVDEDDGYILLTKNDEYNFAEYYKIAQLKYLYHANIYTLADLYEDDQIDELIVTGMNYPEYQNDPSLKMTPQTTFFRLAINLDYGRDGDESNDSPILQYIEFRQALYFAFDREAFVRNVRAPGLVALGALGGAYYSTLTNPFAYRASEAGQAVLADFEPETSGYNPVLAKQLFDEAYAKAVADGKIEDGDVVSIRFPYAYAETGNDWTNWVKSMLDIFGDKFNLIRIPVSSFSLSGIGGIWEQGTFDITYDGWQGLQYLAPQMLQVYSDGLGASYIREGGFETGNAELSVDLSHGKTAVEGWLAALEAIAEPTERQETYMNYFEDFLDAFEDTVWTGTYDNLWSHIYTVVLQYDLYAGFDEDANNITAALETELLRQMMFIPLFNAVTNVTVYQSRVVLEQTINNPNIGWNDLRYMFIANSDE